MWNYNKFLLKFIQSLGEISNQLKHEHEMHQNVYLYNIISGIRITNWLYIKSYVFNNQFSTWDGSL